MIGMTTKISGFGAGTKKVLDTIERQRVQAHMELGVIVKSSAQKSMLQGRFPGAGPRGGTLHIPSPAGMPPHTQTTDLMRSIQRAAFKRDGLPVVIVGPTVPIYGAVQEFGSAKLPPRPYMRPALIREIKAHPKLAAGVPEK